MDSTHLFEVSVTQSGDLNGNIEAGVYVPAQSLKELIQQASQLLGLTGNYEVISEAGIRVQSDMVLKLLVEKGQSRFNLRKIECDLDLESATTNGKVAPSASDVEASPRRPSRREEIQEESSDSEPSDTDSLACANESERQGEIPGPSSTGKDENFFPVLDIIRKMKVGRRSKEKADDVIKRLSAIQTADATKEDRKAIHKAVGPWLMSTSDPINHPTGSQMQKMAKSIAHFFPNIAPWEQWYCKRTHSGTLERYIRNKRSFDGLSKVDGRSSAAKRNKMLYSASHHSTEEIKEAVDFMKRNIPNPENKKKMIEMFVLTRAARRKMIAEKKSATLVFNRFPRLTDMFELVESEFFDLQGVKIETMLKNYREIEEKIVLYAKKKLKCSKSRDLIEMIEVASDNFDDADYTLSVLELLLLLLPNNLPQPKRSSTGKSQQKKDPTEKRPKTADCIGMVIQKFPDGYDIKTAIKEAQPASIPGKEAEQLPTTMKQPGIIQIGANFFLKIDETPIQFPSQMCTVESSLACVIAMMYILNLKYPEPLKYFYVFFEHLFEFAKPSADCLSVTDLLRKVKSLTVE